MIEIGKYNILTILRQTSVGLYLSDNDDEDVLLPNKYCPEDFEINDKIEVFVYLDYAERKIATNINPKIYLHEFALLEVTDVTDIGAFLDWGLEKELLVPFSEQKQKMEEGRWYIVFLDLDTKTNRLFASNKINKYLNNESLTVKPNEEVDLLILKKTDLGFSVIINNKHKGLIFSNNIFRDLNIGEKTKGYVKNIRPDNKIDISLQPIGYKNYKNTNSELIYNKLKASKFLEITDKSSPEEIYSTFGISKKIFKKSIGDLYKQKKIIILPNGIKLT